MKKSLLALAVLGAVSGGAFAQAAAPSNVTLYGLIDVYMESATQSTLGTTAGTIVNQRTTRMSSSGLNGSRWGIRGSEDLGGGLRANFVLENGFAIDTGADAQSGLMFGRQATVGLSGDFGSIDFGRNYSLIDGVLFNSDTDGNSTFGQNGRLGQSNFIPSLGSAAQLAAFSGLTLAQATDVFNLFNGISSGVSAGVSAKIRQDNMIVYRTPTFSGFTGALSYSTNVSGAETFPTPGSTVKSLKSIGARLEYRAGPLYVGFAYQDTDVRVPTANVTLTSGYLAPVGTVVVADNYGMKSWTLGSNYDFGIARVFANYSNDEVDNDLIDRHHWQLGARFKFGNLSPLISFGQAKEDVLGKTKSITVGADYDFSRRTTAYVRFAKVDLSGFGTTVSGPSGTTLAPTGEAKTFAVGLRHRF